MKEKNKVPKTRKEKEKQIRKESKASLILFLICVAWSIGFAYGLSGRSQATLWGLPLWWVISVPGLFILSTVGVIFLIKKVFVNFDLDDEEDDQVQKKPTKK